MMEPSSAFPGLEDLVDLGSDTEIDMRPTLLRVLTDLYLQRPAHTAEDERYYTELALRLIDATDLAARTALAERLASYPCAPRMVIERLARDALQVAAPILERSPCLTGAELSAITTELCSAYAELIDQPRSRRATQTPKPSRSLPVQAAELSELFCAAGPA